MSTEEHATGAEQHLTLYTHITSPYCKRVELALAEAGAPFDAHHVDLVHKPAWFLALNPAGKVPVLSVGARPPAPDAPAPGALHLPESLVILELLADVYPALLPAAPADRARARLFAAQIQDRFYPAWAGAIATGRATAAQLVDALEVMQGAMDVQGPYAVGDEWSIADAAFGPFLQQAEVFLRTDVGAFAVGTGRAAWEGVWGDGADARFARLRAYWDAVRGRESWRVVPADDELTGFLPKFMAYHGYKRVEA